MLAPRIVTHDSSFVAMIARSKNTGSGFSRRSRIRMARICSPSVGFRLNSLPLLDGIARSPGFGSINHKGPSVGVRERHPERVSIHKPLQAVAPFEWHQRQIMCPAQGGGRALSID